VIDPATIQNNQLLPWSSAATAALAIGSAIGLGLSWLLVVTGVLKRSYEPSQTAESPDIAPENPPEDNNPPYQADDPNFNHRAESLREILFLLPMVACAIAAYWIASSFVPIETWRSFPTQHPALSGLLGSLFGYFVGCALVWAVRILGTLGFGKEAMGLGDVHLMGAAGAVIGPIPVVVAFFIAPFFGLAWAGGQMFFKKIRQIPYGPFLSLGILVVMIFNDCIMNRLSLLFYR
jgi:leader peptidase (prepilin peptidase)/N-methyltransferase